MSLNLAPVLRQRYFDTNGKPLVGGKIYSYQAGTSTPQSTYTDSGGLTPNSNPVILDANGEANVWLDQALSYKFVLTDSTGVTQWTVDNIIGILTVGAVNTAAIQDGSVTPAKIPDGSLTTTKFTVSVVTKSANYTLTSADDVVLVNAAGGILTMTLPTAIGISGRIYRIKKTDSTFNAVTIATTAAQTIDGLASRTMNTQYEGYEFVSDGANWLVVEHKTDTPWAPYALTISATPTPPTKGTTAKDQAYWRRQGDSIQIRYEYRQTAAGVAGSGNYLFSIPTGCVIDGTKVDTTPSALSQSFGICAIRADTNQVLGNVFYGNSTNLFIYVQAVGQVSDALYSLSGTNIWYGFTVTVPISGWSE